MSGHQTLQREARRSHHSVDHLKKCCSPIFPSADMKSPSPGNGPPNAQEEKSGDPDKPTEQTQSEMEKDSGYYDSSSESLSSEETPPGSAATSVIVSATTPSTSDESQTQTSYAPVYILQNVVLKQPHVVLLVQPPLKRHRKRVSPPSYLPILRSYPKIAPRISPPSSAPDPPKDTAPVPSDSSSKVCKQPAPQLLEVSLRSLALLRRTRETQRSICELRAHTILYERALQGEEGGWERLRMAMEISGGYRKIPPAISIERTEEADGALQDTAEESTTAETTGDSSPAAEEPETQENVTSAEKPMTSSEEAGPPPDKDTGEAV